MGITLSVGHHPRTLNGGPPRCENRRICFGAFNHCASVRARPEIQPCVPGFSSVINCTCRGEQPLRAQSHCPGRSFSQMWHADRSNELGRTCASK
eukprot:7208911-Prymnesium_polylepis.1